MGVDIHDSEDHRCTIHSNWWQWRSTVELIRSLDLLNGPRLDLLSDGMGELTEAEARQIASAFERQVLPGLHPDQRVLLDGAVTTEPDDGTFHRVPVEQHRNYSADRDWLIQFVAFCNECRGLYVC